MRRDAGLAIPSSEVWLYQAEGPWLSRVLLFRFNSVFIFQVFFVFFPDLVLWVSAVDSCRWTFYRPPCCQCNEETYVEGWVLGTPFTQVLPDSRPETCSLSDCIVCSAVHGSRSKVQRKGKGIELTGIAFRSRMIAIVLFGKSSLHCFFVFLWSEHLAASVLISEVHVQLRAIQCYERFPNTYGRRFSASLFKEEKRFCTCYYLYIERVPRSQTLRTVLTHSICTRFSCSWTTCKPWASQILNDLNRFFFLSWQPWKNLFSDTSPTFAPRLLWLHAYVNYGIWFDRTHFDQHSTMIDR